jgi:hypothetical protein
VQDTTRAAGDAGYPRRMNDADGIGQRLAAAGGAVLGAVFRVVGEVRPSPKPLHPRGDVLRAELHREGSQEKVGVPLLDEPGVDVATARVSRATGLPAPWPDIHGLAVRVPLPDGRRGDLLLASTGLGPASRFLLKPARHPGALTTLLPYVTPTGPLLLGATSQAEGRYGLLWARPRGPWHPWGRLVLRERCDGDPLLSFDPVANPFPALAHPAWVRRLREPAYAQARRSRRRAQRPAT